MIRALEKMNFGPNMYGPQIHKQKYIVIINNKHQCIEYVSPMQHNYLICIILGFLNQNGSTVLRGVLFQK